MHTYEEIREVIVDILLGRKNVNYPPSQFESLKNGVAEVLLRREGVAQVPHQPRLDGNDAELVRDAFWDLFRQGYITLGSNDSNPQWPHFRISHLGGALLEQGQPYRFTNTATYLDMVREHVPDLDEITAMYLNEAVQSFYAGCILASCVMLGVATENRFLRLLEAAFASPMHGEAFRVVRNERTILRKIVKFTNLSRNHLRDLPNDISEDLETNFSSIQAVIRTFRNEAGHPTGNSPSREQTYVLLQLFAPYAKKLAQLEVFLREGDG